MNSVTTINCKFNCLECGNELEVPAELRVGDFFECDFCGIEYVVKKKTEAGEFVLEISDEEK